jgi:hypothetical protein
VKTTSGATAVQIVHSPRGLRDVEHFGPARDVVELEAAEALGMSRRPIYPKIREYGHRRPGGRLTRLRFGQMRS